MTAKSSKLYQSKNCPCPADCVRHGKCKECIEFHHKRGEVTFCEALENAHSKPTGSDDGRPLSGRQIRLLDYTKCAG